MAGSLAAGGMDPGAVSAAAAASPGAVSAEAQTPVDSEAPGDHEAPATAGPASATDDPASATDDPAPAVDDPAPANDDPVPASVGAAGLKRDISYGFGKGGSWTTTDAPRGTVLGYAGVPRDIGTANQHFVYYPLPKTTTTSTTTTTYNTGYQETLSLSKYVTGTTGDLGLAIDKDGVVWSWGGNASGQLGNGTVGTTAISPAKVSTLPAGVPFVQVSAGGKHALALSASGDVYVWGSSNSNGQLGQGNTATVSPPQSRALKVNVPNVKFKQVSAGDDYSLAVTTTGQVYSWGLNRTGANGVGATTGTPTVISGLSNIAMVSAGYSHSGAVTTTGELYMWGYQFNGQLGNGVSGASSSGPVRVGAAQSWRQVSAGNAATWAVTKTGALFAWGMNSDYRLGLGDTTQRTTPAQTSLTDVKQVSGNLSAVAVTNGGLVYVAGTNKGGQLGTGGDGSLRSTWYNISSGASEVQTGVYGSGIGFKSTVLDSSGRARMWGTGVQNGLGGGATTAPSVLGSVFGSPAVPWVTETTTTTTETILDDTKAAGSRIVFGDPADPNAVTGRSAQNIAVVTYNGVKYLRGDVPPHDAGPVVVWLQWNDGTNVWQNTGPYTYTIALSIGALPLPAQTTETVAVTTGFFEPLEAPFAGSSVVDFSIPALSGNPPSLLPVAGTTVNGVPWATAGGTTTAVTKVTLRPGEPANDGAGRWLYDAKSTARVGAVPVYRNVPTTPIRFEAPTAVDVHLWKTGISTSGSEVGMAGSAWKVYRDSATSPGTPDTTTTVTAFGSETTNPNTGVPSRRQGWFNASLTPGTYWLVETRAPAGFQLMAQPVQFAVATNGSVTLGTGKSALTRVSNDWDSGSTVNTIVVLDPGATPLPPAGSEPWTWIIFLGIGILGLGILLVVRRIVARRRSILAEE